MIAPPEPVAVKVNERSGEALLTLYLQGRREAEGRLEEIEGLDYKAGAEKHLLDAGMTEEEIAQLENKLCGK